MPYSLCEAVSSTPMTTGVQLGVKSASSQVKRPHCHRCRSGQEVYKGTILQNHHYQVARHYEQVVGLKVLQVLLGMRPDVLARLGSPHDEEVAPRPQQGAVILYVRQHPCEHSLYAALSGAAEPALDLKPSDLGGPDEAEPPGSPLKFG
eukprot:CAMPEP_0178411886 /NCGR_PEP_ID=MMETSP0689_2-20121128/21726_1 /TAXON_ID=160604 /ORGANISM="Amphidinium massartii, Strain CS-259" /LENGTH=148 /DNA_ID=CAMNT_0020033107 /DNA_START=205 /DNA_END=651 /DNA_ORIENTATION=+